MGASLLLWVCEFVANRSAALLPHPPIPNFPSYLDIQLRHPFFLETEHDAGGEVLHGSLSALALTDSDLAEAVGRTAGNTIHAGEMLVRPDLASGPLLGPDQVSVTIPVKPDTIYAGLRPTDEVAVLATSNAGKADSRTVTLLDRATVFDVGLERRIIRSVSAGNPDEGGELKHITVAVPRSEAEVVANAIANSQLTIVLLSRREHGSEPPGP